MGKQRIFFMLGGPGSGTTKHSKLLKERYGFGHISYQEVIKDLISSNTPIAKKVSSMMDNGEVIPLGFVQDALKKQLDYFLDKYFLILVDGVPNSMEDVDEWSRSFGSRTEVHGVMSFDVREEVMMQ